MRKSTAKSVPADKTGADFFMAVTALFAGGRYVPGSGTVLRTTSSLRTRLLRALACGGRAQPAVASPFTSLTGVSTCVREISAVDCRYVSFSKISHDKKK